MRVRSGRSDPSARATKGSIPSSGVALHLAPQVFDADQALNRRLMGICATGAAVGSAAYNACKVHLLDCVGGNEVAVAVAFEACSV